MLGRLSLFVGGFDLAAAENVCSAEPIDEFAVLDLLGSMVDKSLVMLDESGADPRYRMLDTIREYAREKLDAGETSATIAQRHCEFYFALAKQAHHGSFGPQQALWMRRLESELDNLRAAIALALSGGVEPVIVVKLAVALQGFWILRGYCAEGRRVVKAALELPAIAAADHVRAHALYVGAALAEHQSDHAEALNMLEACLELRRGLGIPVEMASTLSTLSLARLQAGDALGAGVGEHEALEIFRRMGDRIGESIGLLHLGQIAQHVGDDDQARGHLLEALRIAREIEYREVEGECELVLGEIALDAGDLASANERLTRSLAICREAADKRGEANALRWQGRADLAGGLLALAHARLVEALQSFRDAEMWGELLGCLEDCVGLALQFGQPATAANLALTLAATRDRLSLVRTPRSQARWLAQSAALSQAPAAPSAAHAEVWEIDAAIGAVRALTAPADQATGAARTTLPDGPRAFST